MTPTRVVTLSDQVVHLCSYAAVGSLRKLLAVAMVRSDPKYVCTLHKRFCVIKFLGGNLDFNMADVLVCYV